MIRPTLIFWPEIVPKVKKIVYSTCSVYPTENEQVVVQALLSEEAKQGNFKLAPRSAVIPKWQRRGIPGEMGEFADSAESLIRCSPGEDATNGFFVSCFIRSTDASSAGDIIPRSKRKAGEELGDTPDEETLVADMTEVGASNKKRKKRKKKQKEVLG